MTVNENPGIIHLSCNENLCSPVGKHSDSDLRNLECSCRHFCRDSLNKVSTVKKKTKQTTTTMKIYGIVQTSTYDYTENV